MKLATNYVDQITGLDIVSSGVLVLLFILFLWIIYRIYRTSKNDSDRWGNLPLEMEGDAVNTNFKE
ncbi:MAG: hypothetical protein DRJ10_20350 [Bacteroidetes bacterium]|nr:MAG: hypothetical protein DRJ10_20350 [Bacteroidota bacterium]